jgi:UDP-N-acetylglucosamine/UDP-N-acetylgalactosamine diphosphorylase
MKEQLLAQLKPFGQDHLLAHWDRLDEHQREDLADEIERIDLALIERLVRQPRHDDEICRLADQAGPPPAFRLGDPSNRFSPREAVARGTAALRAGEVGVILVAGGQGTRLGFDHPKGMFSIGPVSGATLFQILTEKVLAVSRRYEVRVPMYVMTSPATHHETVEFFVRHENFGLPAEDLKIFCQGTMPAVDAETGKILLDSPDGIALSPDGHGGMLAALARSGGLDDAADRGLKHFFYMQVDNPLVHACLPEFLGYHLLAGSEMTTQVVRKRDPLERVGNVVRIGDRLRVIEYSDLPDEIAGRRAPDGSLEIWAGSIAVHAMAVDFLRRMADSAEGLPFHIAYKKVRHIDASGQAVVPEKPNAIKFERFIFDLLPSAANAVVVEIDPAQHFGPLKNAPGAAQDTPDAVRAQLIALHRDWLRPAGVEVAEGVAVEISPLFALDAEVLAEKVQKGTRIVEPTYFR